MQNVHIETFNQYYERQLTPVLQLLVDAFNKFRQMKGGQIIWWVKGVHVDLMWEQHNGHTNLKHRSRHPPSCLLVTIQKGQNELHFDLCNKRGAHGVGFSQDQALWMDAANAFIKELTQAQLKDCIRTLTSQLQGYPAASSGSSSAKKRKK